MYLNKTLKINLVALLVPFAAMAQGDMYIPASGNAYFFGSASAFGNVTNNGNLGTTSSTTLSFYGTNWINGSAATLPVIGVGTGGTIAFVQPNPLTAGNALQNLEGGYSSGSNPSFPHVNINNANNVSLSNTNTRITEDLGFTSGKVVLNSLDLVMGSNSGNGGAGTISGYDENKYVVSNNVAGHLVKESYTGDYTFPVGKGTSNVLDYAPAKVNNAAANGIHVNVSNYASTSGAAPRTTNDGIDRTWNIYGNNVGTNTTIDLQHDNSSNQSDFRSAKQYVTRFVGTQPNTVGDMFSVTKWEHNTAAAGSASGTLTTGAAIATASERSRLYTSLATSSSANSAYYTKESGPLCLNVRAYLEGSLIDNGSATASDGRPLMRDDLRNSPYPSAGTNYIPSADPYETATPKVNVVSAYIKMAPQTTYTEFQQVTSPSVFSVSGQNAIVDWVFVELRSKSNNATVQATRAGLIQRDGDIVDVDGQSCLSFPGVAVDSYYVSVRHRSHLGAMTKYGQSASNLETLVDFTVPGTPIYDKGTFGPYNYA
ncbi:MAG: hypothetical protein JST27_05000, partial [Bacteroidetes bacterium]|nr:hypothetical protein [Bacteroidota bacterium]